jgi:ParB family chromosome partitioning protein
MAETVPCLVRPDLDGMTAEQIVGMIVENDQCLGLTESERASGYAQLELFGLDDTEIAWRTRRKVEHVTAALKLTKLGDKARAAADKGTLTLDDVQTLEEFDGDPKAMARILKDAGSTWGIRHNVLEECRSSATRPRRSSS